MHTPTNHFRELAKMFAMLYAGALAATVFAIFVYQNYTVSSDAAIRQPYASRTFRMKPQVQNGIVTFTQLPSNQVRVELHLNPAGFTDQPAHIHEGTCENPGKIIYPLNTVVNGVSTTTINTTLAELLTKRYIVNVHKSASESNVYTSCTPITMNSFYTPGPDQTTPPMPTPIVINPTPGCTPRPACLDSTPPCLIAEPAIGWCPTISGTPYPTQPMVTCIPRPACLDSVPRCMIAEPAEGWCPATNVTPKLMPLDRAPM